MRKLKIDIKTFVILAFSFQLSAFAANYYVDYSTGSDLNAGTSTGAPWKHSPGDPAASGSVPLRVNPGDTVLFHGGVAYTIGGSGYINISETTQAGANLITYRSGDRSSPQWGTTPAFIDASLATTSVGIINLASGVSNVVIDGFTIANQQNNNDYVGMIGTTLSGGNIIIENCTLTNGAGCGIYLEGAGNPNPNPANFVVSNCFIQYFNWHGIFLRYGMNNATITNCWVHYTGMPVYAGGGAGDNITLYEGSATQMTNVFINGNDLGTTPTKGCVLLETPITGLSIVGNTLHGTNQTGGLMFNEQMTNILCANNLWNLNIAMYEGLYRFYSDVTTVYYENLKILNDTIVGGSVNGSIIYLTPGASTGVNGAIFHNLTIENCIVSNSPALGVPLAQINLGYGGAALCVDTATFTCDYNVWNSKTSSSTYGFLVGGTGETGSGGTNYTFAGWQSKFGTDAHSTTATPTYNAGTFIPSSTDTVAGNAGVNLFTLFQTDIRGAARPATGPWTIGAFLPSAGLSSRLSIVGGGQILVTGGGQIIVSQ